MALAMTGAATSPGEQSVFGYRPHLDGLRAVAVYLVVLFHGGAARFEGGFIGVDVFFVLSGYLVTSLAARELRSTGKIDLLGFYARRVRRLLPAASAAIVGIAVLSIATIPASGRASFEGDGRAASLWFSNWWFIGEDTEYFDADFVPTPFLHFWSLAIEEQFYFLFPLAMSALWLLTGRSIGRMLGVVASGTVVLTLVQVVVALNSAARAYYGLDTRAYQLGAGVTLALAAVAVPGLLRERRVGPPVLAVSLVGTVLASTSLWGPSVSTRGLVATALAVALIVGAELSGATGAGGPAWLLSRPSLTYLGRISYGTYLWHWPVIVFSAVYLDAPPIATVLIAGVAGTALAALSYELLEYPIRGSAALKRFRGLSVVAGVALALIVGLVAVPAILGLTARPMVAPAQHLLQPGSSGQRVVASHIEGAEDDPTDSRCTAQNDSV